MVKLLKKYRNNRFLLQIILLFSFADRKDWNVFGQGMPWLFCKIYRMSLHACHAVKSVFPGNIRKFSNIQENLWKSSDYTTCLFFKCLRNSAKYTGWTNYRLCCTAIVLTLHRWNILIIFKQLSVLPFLWKILRHVLLIFNFEKMESTRLAKMNRKITARIILFV